MHRAHTASGLDISFELSPQLIHVVAIFHQPCVGEHPLLKYDMHEENVNGEESVAIRVFAASQASVNHKNAKIITQASLPWENSARQSL